MISDFVSADLGFMRSPDEQLTARRVFKPGNNRDGYFTNDDVIRQALDAADLVQTYWPLYKHVFIFDNAPTHSKRPDDALSARRMPKFTSKSSTN